MQVVKFAFVKSCRLEIARLRLGAVAIRSVVEIVIGQNRIAGTLATLAPDPVSPSNGTDNDDNQNNLTRLVVSCPLGFVQLLLVVFLSSLSAVLCIANAGLRPLLAINSTVGRVTTNAADVDTHEAIQHVPTSSWKIKRHHVRRVVDQNVGQISSLLPEASVRAFESPVASRRPVTRCHFEAFSTIPFHFADQVLGSNMVADEIFSSGEKHDRDFLQKIGQKFLDGIDVEGIGDLGLPQIRCQVHQIRGPVHATARVGIRESHIVHVNACIFAITLLGQPEHVGQDSFALSIVHVANIGCHHLLTAAQVCLKFLVVVGVLLDDALLKSHIGLSRKRRVTYIVVVVLWEEGKPLLKEVNELVGHLLQLVYVLVSINGTVTGADRVVNEKEIGEFVPGAIVVDQVILILQSIGADFHHGTIF
ncbi:hypothetical protein HG530_013499 [Fusarium avenaceum]|nr:hypothetical protein HG530_013499 [Fusarium avenaceum]